MNEEEQEGAQEEERVGYLMIHQLTETSHKT